MKNKPTIEQIEQHLKDLMIALNTSIKYCVEFRVPHENMDAKYQIVSDIYKFITGRRFGDE